MNMAAAQFAKSWKTVEPVLTIRNKRDYDAAIERMHALLDDGADATRHPMHGLLYLLGLAIRDYEDRHIDIPDASPSDVLAFLIQQHGLRQSDLPEVGPQSTISDLLNGRREFNKRHIIALSRRFGVPADVFMDETAYLRLNPANARHLRESMKQLDKAVPRRLAH